MVVLREVEVMQDLQEKLVRLNLDYLYRVQVEQQVILQEVMVVQVVQVRLTPFDQVMAAAAAVDLAQAAVVNQETLALMVNQELQVSQDQVQEQDNSDNQEKVVLQAILAQKVERDNQGPTVLGTI